jgi:DNA-binding IscR family transcriptional regulator
MLSKKTKYGIKALTFWLKKIRLLAIAKAKIFRLSFRKYFIFLRHSGLFGAKKGKGGGYYLIKTRRRLIWLMFIAF